MNYFTREWASGKLGDEEVLEIYDSYQEHLRELGKQAPPSVLDLALKYNFHDGLIVKVEVNLSVSSLLLVLRCGDLQEGYKDITLNYSGVRYSRDLVDALALISKDSRSELLYDEVSMCSAGLAEHSMLFHPQGEINIQFANVDICCSAKSDRKVDRSKSRFTIHD